MKKPKSVLVLGSGPIIIGQACEFDYSGTQACRVLREEGVSAILLNSNPATIMTDPHLSDRTYIEPLDVSSVLSILRKEKIEAILPTMGGQTALNLIQNLSQIPGALDGIEIIGASLRSIHLAEDRRAFRELVQSIGFQTPNSAIIRSVAECQEFARESGYPFILRPSFTLGGTGQSMVMNSSELIEKAEHAIHESPIGEVLVEESLLGWKEYELELMRDHKDNAIIVCSIENLDPMGIHTGESVTVAPAQTLTDREYQIMRSEAISIIRAVGVQTGGCNIQFAVQPQTGRRMVIEMNPRVSRSSALASKATGFPIAYVATKLALGYSLDEIPNVITKTTMACFEPPLDYVAVKIPRWSFEKFPGVRDEIGTQMQSVGEVLALGGSFGEAYHKALCSLERSWPKFSEEELTEKLKQAHSLRSFAVWDALAGGFSPQKVSCLTGWDPWFPLMIRTYQKEEGLKPGALSLSAGEARYQMIDTCSGETRVETAFFYSTREKLGGSRKSLSPELPAGKKGRVVILGSGPNRIGQGIEFDYCCVHASWALQEMGYETILVNCNPETVSTDPSVSTRLYLEPLCQDSVKAILGRELDPLLKDKKPAYVLLQTGGQTPLKLSSLIEEWGYPILGTSSTAIDLCEDREKFAALLSSLDISYPAFSIASSYEEFQEKSKELGLPILVRPSFVLGGRAMRICTSEKDLESVFWEAKQVSEKHPVFLDKFLNEAVEFDVDGICDGKRALISGVMEHVEEAGVHSGDSSCVIPPFRLPTAMVQKMAKMAQEIAQAVGVKGFFNVQMAVIGEKIYVLEANPRASRTIPFLAKATGSSIVKWAIRAALGEKIEKSDLYIMPSHGYAVKTPVFPFNKFRDFDPILGPEMRSTGEVMGLGYTVGEAFAKAFSGAGVRLPAQGAILVSIRDQDKPKALNILRLYRALGFEFFGTPGSADYLQRAGIPCQQVQKIGAVDGQNTVLTLMEEKKVHLVINTTGTLHSLKDGKTIRKAAMKYRIPLLSTLSAAEMASLAIQDVREKGMQPVALQDFVAAEIQ